MKKYFCVNCGYIYDELVGEPERGVASGTLVSMLSGDWCCPDCGGGVERLCARSVYNYETDEVELMNE